jgi:hypothetical protein
MPEECRVRLALFVPWNGGANLAYVLSALHLSYRQNQNQLRFIFW